MGVIRQMAGGDSRENRPGCPRSDFLERGGYSGIPFFRPRARAIGVPRLNRSLQIFARSKTMWTLTPCGRKERAHKVWKSRTEREIPTAPTSILFLSWREKNEDHNHSSQLSTESDHPNTEFLVEKQLPSLTKWPHGATFTK